MSDEAQPPEGTTDRPMLDGSHGDSVTPKDLKVQLAEQRLIVDWKDGGHREYSLGELRGQCPCATCRAERAEQDGNPLRILKSDPRQIRVTHAELVGNYGIRFRWSDGHDTGIFDFRLLRSLDRGRA